MAASQADSPRLPDAFQRTSIPRPVATATPAYSLVSEKLRRVSAGSLQCALFCGGPRCKYEVSHRWKEAEKALEGLFSHWVTEDILAMARPSTVLFREYDLIDQFKRSVPSGLRKFQVNTTVIQHNFVILVMIYNYMT